VTAYELYTSLKKMYKDFIFKHGWKMHEIDQMDAHFFYELVDYQEERKVYIDEIW